MYIVNISSYIIDIHSNIYWGDSDGRQQAIAPTNVDIGLGRRYQALQNNFEVFLHMVR